MAKRKPVDERPHLLCDTCQKARYLQQEDFTFCEMCGSPVISYRRPPYKLCNACAVKHNVCEQCGEDIDF